MNDHEVAAYVDVHGVTLIALGWSAVAPTLPATNHVQVAPLTRLGPSRLLDEIIADLEARLDVQARALAETRERSRPEFVAEAVRLERRRLREQLEHDPDLVDPKLREQLESGSADEAATSIRELVARDLGLDFDVAWSKARERFLDERLPRLIAEHLPPEEFGENDALALVREIAAARSLVRRRVEDETDYTPEEALRRLVLQRSLPTTRLETDFEYERLGRIRMRRFETVWHLIEELFEREHIPRLVVSSLKQRKAAFYQRFEADAKVIERAHRINAELRRCVAATGRMGVELRLESESSAGAVTCVEDLLIIMNDGLRCLGLPRPSSSHR